MADEYRLESDDFRGILWSVYRWGRTAEPTEVFSPETLLAAVIERHGLQTEPDPIAQAVEQAARKYMERDWQRSGAGEWAKTLPARRPLLHLRTVALGTAARYFDDAEWQFAQEFERWVEKLVEEQHAQTP